MPLNDQPNALGRALTNRAFQRNTSRGFTLLEVLIAVVVLSLGLLGLAGLQVASLNNNQTAYYRAVATQQAYDMMDRMRANLAGVSPPIPPNPPGVAGSYDNLSATIPANPGCITAGCTTAQMATTDQFQWLTNTAAVLPAGAGTVRCIQGPAATCVTNTATSNRIFDITVTWIEKNSGADPNCPVGTPANTRCFVTEFAP